MGLKIIDENNLVLSRIDLDIKDNPFYIVCSINNVDIKYSNFAKMIADKLVVISGEHIFRRTKDLLDIYLIITNTNISKAEIERVLIYDKRKLGNFATMFNNKTILKESYHKLKGIENKPDFDKVWETIINFLKKESFIDFNEK